jgi:hypothetical protein
MAVKTAATAAALALVAGWYLFGSSAAAEDDDDFDEESAVPREQVLEIFYELKKQMPQKMAQVVQQLEQIRAQYPTIPQEQLTKLRKCTHRLSILGFSPSQLGVPFASFA